MEFANTPMPKIVCIEANIGAGKSTLLRGLQEHGFKVLPEPLHDWVDLYRDDSGSILEHLYSEPKRWAFTYQIMALHTRVKAVKDAIQECQQQGIPILIIERSLLTTYQIFTKVLVQMGAIGPIEARLFRDVHESLLQGLGNMHYCCIYLKTDPAICMERIQRRARNGELSISPDYLMRLHNRHEQWLNMVTHYPVCGDDDPETVLINTLYYLRNLH